MLKVKMLLRGRAAALQAGADQVCGRRELFDPDFAPHAFEDSWIDFDLASQVIFSERVACGSRCFNLAQPKLHDAELEVFHGEGVSFSCASIWPRAFPPSLAFYFVYSIPRMRSKAGSAPVGHHARPPLRLSVPFREDRH